MCGFEISFLPDSDWDIKVKGEGIRGHESVRKKDKQTSDTNSIGCTELSFHWGGSQESCPLAGCARAAQSRTGSLTVWLLCHSLGKAHGSRAVADLRWSWDWPSGDTEQAESLLWTSLFRSSGAWWLWRDRTRGGLTSWLWSALRISSKLQGVITSHQVCLAPTPFFPAWNPEASQPLSTVGLTTESLGGSWAECHWHGNNKEQKLNRGTLGVLWG